MKKLFLFIIVSGLFLLPGFCQYNMSFTAGVGATAVDVEKAINSDQLENWNTFSYGVLLNGEKKMLGGMFFSGELGWQKLYYWEEYYLNTSGYRNYRWGAVATVILGGLARMPFTERFSGFGGLNIRVFTDESGTSLALPFGVQYKAYSSGNVEVPVGFRTDVVFGSAIPIAFNLTLGLRYNL